VAVADGASRIGAGSLPAEASAVVIGGGAMGCSTLYHLAKEGADAVLLERDKLTSGTTWHSAGQVRTLRPTKNFTELVRYSIDLYSRLEEETGQSPGWICEGSVVVASNPDRMVSLRRQAALAGLFGVSAELLTPGEARERWPLLETGDLVGAAWSPEDGRVSPSDLCAALAKGARAAGAKIFEDVGVTGILTERGKVRGVDTSQGHVRCEAVVICAGLWSRAVAGMAGADAPLWPCEHLYLLTKPLAEISGHLPTLVDQDSCLYIRDEGGGLLAGSFEPDAKGIDPARLGDDFAFQLLPEDWEHFEPMMENAIRRVPAFATAEAKALINGPESFTPDGMSMLGAAPDVDGLFLGCGMNSFGIASSGGAGMALAHRIVRGCMPAALPEADPARFAKQLNFASALRVRGPEILGYQYQIPYPGKQLKSARNLRRSPLHDRWVGARAHFGQTFGWERPLYFGCESAPNLTFDRPEWFGRVGEEVRQAHECAAVFDLSSYGKISVRGADAEKFLSRVCTNDMTRAPGRAVFTLMLDENGGIESDLVSLRIAGDRYVIYAGAAAARRDFAWLRRSILPGERVHLRDGTGEWALLALCGPDAARVVCDAGAPELCDLKYFGHCQAEIAGMWVRATRMSYVGEMGWELTCRDADAVAIFDVLQGAGAQPAGMYAQDSMRIEKGNYVWGPDLDQDITPLEAGLETFVDWSKPFTGREAVARRKERGLERAFVTVAPDDREANPIGNEPVSAGGKIIGRTTSGCHGYRAERPLALALVEARDLPDRVSVEISGKAHDCEVIRGAAYDPDNSRLRAKPKGNA